MIYPEETEEQLSYLKFLSSEALRAWKKSDKERSRKMLVEAREFLDRLLEQED